MIQKIFAVLACAAAIIGAYSDMYIPAAVFSALFLVFSFIKLNSTELRIILVTAAGFPMLLLSGSSVAAGILTFLLVVSVLLSAGTKLSAAVIVLSLCAGVCGLLSTAALVIVAAVIFLAAGIYIVFIKEYRLKKNAEVRIK
ncbi:MAG: hypothetical protein Q4Q53_07965 [Methanocorpusculum sp.]|nr:hypothetical protein [Methanocorpusculum sp.]